MGAAGQQLLEERLELRALLPWERREERFQRRAPAREQLVDDLPAGALIIASVPLWVAVLQLAYREPVTRRTGIAVAAGFAGIVLLVSPGGQAPVLWLLVLVGAAAVEAAGQFYAQRTTLPNGRPVLLAAHHAAQRPASSTRSAPRCPTTGQFYSQRTMLPGDPLVSTTVQLVAAGAALVVAGAVLGELGDLRFARFSQDSAIAFAYLVVPGSLIAYSAFVWLLRNVPVGIVATYAYVNPVVVAVGAALLGERITPLMLAGGALILCAVASLVSQMPRGEG